MVDLLGQVFFWVYVALVGVYIPGGKHSMTTEESRAGTSMIFVDTEPFVNRKINYSFFIYSFFFFLNQFCHIEPFFHLSWNESNINLLSFVMETRLNLVC